MRPRVKRERHAAGLWRFVRLGPEQARSFERIASRRTEPEWSALVMRDPIGSHVYEALGAPLFAEVTEAARPTADPILNELHRACAMYERPWPDLDGTPSREGRPHPLVVLALARRFWPGDRARADRDVTAWALWTYCQVPRRGQRGRPHSVDLGDRRERVHPELHGLVAEADVLNAPALFFAFPVGTVHRAIARVERLARRASEQVSPTIL